MWRTVQCELSGWSVFCWCWADSNSSCNGPFTRSVYCSLRMLAVFWLKFLLKNYYECSILFYFFIFSLKSEFFLHLVPAELEHLFWWMKSLLSNNLFWVEKPTFNPPVLDPQKWAFWSTLFCLCWVGKNILLPFWKRPATVCTKDSHFWVCLSRGGAAQWTTEILAGQLQIPSCLSFSPFSVWCVWVCSLFLNYIVHFCPSNNWTFRKVSISNTSCWLVFLILTLKIRITFRWKLLVF